MAKLSLNNITAGFASTAALNANFDAIETAIENTVSRDGTTPNQMTSDLDMNSNGILNLASLDVDSLSINGVPVGVGGVVPTEIPDQTGHTNKFMQTNGTVVSWQVPDASEVSYTPAGTGAVDTTVQSKLRESVSVKDFGAVGDGVADDTAAIQAAIDFVQSNYSTLQIKPAIYFPDGRYLITTLYIAPDRSVANKGSGITLFTNGVGSVMLLVNVNGYGIIVGEAASFAEPQVDVGQPAACTNITISGFQFHATGDGYGAGAVCNAIGISDAPNSLIENCYFSNFTNAIVGYRMTTTRIVNCEIWCTGRGASGVAESAIKLKGLLKDGVVNAGGNIFISNLNVRGAQNTDLGLDGILVNSVDGLYIEQSHLQFCNNAIKIEPLNDGVNITTIDVKVDKVYFDDPCNATTDSTNWNNVRITGDIGNTSKVQDISFSHCYFRGANEALSALRIDTTSSLGNKINRVVLQQCLIRQHKNTPIRVIGTAVVSTLKVSDSIFESGSSDGSATYSTVSMSGDSLAFTNNILDAEANAPLTGILAFTGASSAAWCDISNNVFKNSKYAGALPINIAGTVGKTQIYGNVYKVATNVLGDTIPFTLSMTSGHNEATDPIAAGIYTKIGSLVFVQIDLLIAASSLDGSAIVFDGMPFANKGSSLAIPATRAQRSAYDPGEQAYWSFVNGSTVLELLELPPSSATSTGVVSQVATAAPSFGRLSFFYHAE